jgi:imidazolonepropionase-like amidohydrolase
VGDENEWGSIREGRSADLVILRADPLDDIVNTRTIVEVVRAGIVIDRAALCPCAERRDRAPRAVS